MSKSISKLLREFREATEPLKRAVFSFGRMNPMTKGHLENFDRTMDLAGDKFLFISHSQDAKKNPLPPELKLEIAKAARPTYPFHLTTRAMPSVIQIAKYLEYQGYDAITMAVGEDRVDEFEILLAKYNGKEYNFKEINVVTTGDRDEDNISGTKQRQLAIDGDWVRFKANMGPDVPEEMAKKAFDTIRQVMIKAEVAVRESYIAGDLFKVGSLVKESATGRKLRVVDRGSNYLRVADSKGDMSRVWLTAVEQIAEGTAVAPSTSDQITFCGYTTKRFNKQIAEQFKPILEGNDTFAIYSAIKFTDQFFATAEVDVMQEAFDKSGKFLNSLNATGHTYRDQMEMQIAEAIVKDIPSILKITKKDKTKTADIIAAACGVKATGTPEEVVNAAARAIKKDQPSEDILPTYGEMLALADEVGIQWDKRIFSPKQLQLMGMVAPVDEQALDDLLEVIAEHICSFGDILDLYEAHELSVVTKTTRQLVESFEGDSLEDKVAAAQRPARPTDEPKKLVVNEPSDPKTLVKRARELALKYMKDRQLRSVLGKLSDKERNKLEDILRGRGSIISASTKKLVKKISDLEAERLTKSLEQGV